MNRFLLALLISASIVGGQTITTLQTTTTFGNSRTAINTNFTELNTYTMKNHVFNDMLMISTPGTNPASGYLRFYAKAGNQICWKTSAGTEACAGTGSGDVVGPGAGTGGELSILSADGLALTRSNLTGVLKVTAGVPSVVTGTSTNCVFVDGTSGLCGGNPYISTYNFTAQAPGGTLTGGSPATVTLAPCPVGVAGANTSHYLRISAGVGTAEAALITGGTCTSGASSGTITFTPTNNHTGAWEITSATSGWKEAEMATGPGGTIDLADAEITLYATMILTQPYVTHHGNGRGAMEPATTGGTNITYAGVAAADAVKILGPVNGIRIQNLRVNGDALATPLLHIHACTTCEVTTSNFVNPQAGGIGVRIEAEGSTGNTTKLLFQSNYMRADTTGSTCMAIGLTAVNDAAGSWGNLFTNNACLYDNSTAASHGLQLGWADNNIFQGNSWQAENAPGSGSTIEMTRQAGAYAFLPSENRFIQDQIGANATVTAVSGTSGTGGNTFWPWQAYDSGLLPTDIEYLNGWVPATGQYFGGDWVYRGKATVAGASSDGVLNFHSYGFDVSAATNATPIVITTNGAHGLSDGARVFITGVQGNTGANGNFVITAASGSTLTLVDSKGTGTYTKGGNLSAYGGLVGAYGDGFRSGSETATPYILRAKGNDTVKVEYPEAANVPRISFLNGGRLNAKTTYSGLGDITAVEGDALVCTDCTQASPCATGGTGAWAKYINSAWDCSGGGSGTGTGNVTHSDVAITNEMVLFKDASGTNIKRATQTGVVKMVAGVVDVVDQTDPDLCIYADGDVGSCGTGTGGATEASDLTDFKATISPSNTIVFAAGNARIGNYASTRIGSGQLVATASDGGDVKVFIDSTNNLVCHKQTSAGITVTETGSIACSNVASPVFPAGSIPLYDLTLSSAEVWTIDNDERAFLTNRGVAEGTGIDVADAGGVATISIDTSTVPTFGGTNAYTGDNDFSGATRTAANKVGTTAPGTCTVGDTFFDSDAAAGSNLYGCTATNTWTVQAGGGGGISASSTDTLTNKTLDAEGTGNVLTTVSKMWLQAVNCTGLTASLNWDTIATLSPVAACTAGTTNTGLIRGLAEFSNSEVSQMQTHFALPSDWTGVLDLKFKWQASAITGSVVWQAATICVANAEANDVAWNTASTVTDAALGTTLQTNDASITGLTATGCAAGEMLHLKIFRDPEHASDDLADTADLIGVEITTRRAQ